MELGTGTQQCLPRSCQPSWALTPAKAQRIVEEAAQGKAKNQLVQVRVYVHQ